MTELATPKNHSIATAPPPHDDQVVAMWLHGKSKHTKRAYQHEITIFRAFVRQPLATVTLDLLQSFSDSLTGAPATTQRALMAIKSLYAFGHRLGYLHFDTAKALKSKRANSGVRAERILSEAETLRMLDLEPPGRNKVMLRFLYASGVRVAELVSIRWRDCSPLDQGGVVTVTGKRDKTRAINIPEPVWSELTALRKYANQDAKPFGIDPANVWHIVRNAARRAGISKNVSTHWLRHACGSHALHNGSSLTLIQHQFGHASIATTGQYLHALPSEGTGKFLKL